MDSYSSEDFQRDASHCVGLIDRYGSNYKFATRMFPRDMRVATYILYAFLRYTDEIVDEIDPDKTGGQRYQELDNWYSDVALGIQAQSPIARAYAYIANQYHFENEWTDAFLWAMKQDLTKETYQTYQATETYMFGSAVVVGYMMTNIIGFDDSVEADVVFSHARALGEAMQLANFLRDIKEDYLDRNRVYLPQEDLQTYGITINDLLGETYSEQAQDFMKNSIAKCRVLFEHANEGVNYLGPAGRPAVAASSMAYERVLDLIEKNNFVSDPKKCRVSRWHKLYFLLKAYLMKA